MSGDHEEELDALRRDYYLLADQMIFEGNSVQHWKAKASAYGSAIMRMHMALRRVGIATGDIEGSLNRLVDELVELRAKCAEVSE